MCRQRISWNSVGSYVASGFGRITTAATTNTNTISFFTNTSTVRLRSGFCTAQVVTRVAPLAASAIFATYIPFCTPSIGSTMPRADAQKRMAELWEEPRDPESRDMIHGPWGSDSAPNAQETSPYSRTQGRAGH